MDKAHETYMMDILRDVYQFGTARVPYHLLYRWFSAEKIGKRTWLKIIEMWDDVLEEQKDEDGWRIGFLDTQRNDEMTFFCLDPVDAEKSYILPLTAKIS